MVHFRSYWRCTQLDCKSIAMAGVTRGNSTIESCVHRNKPSCTHLASMASSLAFQHGVPHWRSHVKLHASNDLFKSINRLDDRDSGLTHQPAGTIQFLRTEFAQLIFARTTLLPQLCNFSCVSLGTDLSADAGRWLSSRSRIGLASQSRSSQEQ